MILWCYEPLNSLNDNRFSLIETLFSVPLVRSLRRSSHLVKLRKLTNAHLKTATTQHVHKYGKYVCIMRDRFSQNKISYIFQLGLSVSFLVVNFLQYTQIDPTTHIKEWYLVPVQVLKKLQENPPNHTRIQNIFSMYLRTLLLYGTIAIYFEKLICHDFIYIYIYLYCIYIRIYLVQYIRS